MRDISSPLDGFSSPFGPQRNRTLQSLLFGQTEPGQLMPVDPAYLYQDTAGTTQVTATGQSVALWMDRSGRGNNDTQATVGSRPIYGKHPANGYRNMLASSDDFSSAVWSKSTGGVGSAPVVTPNSALAPDGTMTADTVVFALNGGTTSADISQLAQTVATVGTAVFSLWLKTTDGSTKTMSLIAPSGVISKITITGEWQRFNVSGTGGTVARLRLRGDDGVSDSVSVNIWRAQLEAGSTVTEAQRTGATSGTAWPAPPSYDITEVGQADLHYLHYNGVSSFMVSPTITPGIDKAQVFLGVRKLSDAAYGMLIETSVDWFGNNGTIALAAPSGVASNYGMVSKGTIARSITAAATAPITNVVSSISDIANDNLILRINGAQAAISTADQGTGNYLAYPIYTGRRAGTSLPFNGLVYSKIVRFGANLTADQIASTERWTAQRIGVSL